MLNCTGNREVLLSRKAKGMLAAILECKSVCHIHLNEGSSCSFLAVTSHRNVIYYYMLLYIPELQLQRCYLREGSEAVGEVRSMLEAGRSSLLCNLSSSLSRLS